MIRIQENGFGGRNYVGVGATNRAKMAEGSKKYRFRPGKIGGGRWGIVAV
jgi:hypothetical protein